MIEKRKERKQETEEKRAEKREKRKGKERKKEERNEGKKAESKENDGRFGGKIVDVAYVSNKAICGNDVVVSHKKF